MADGEEPGGAEPPKIEEHEATFNGFIRAAVLVGVVSIGILIFLAFVGT
ncbi:MAG: aa3-type cytochrome c oxidase subunit IV [Pseudomonadota bacterium]